MPSTRKALTSGALHNKLLTYINAIIALCEKNYPTEPALLPLKELARKMGDLSVEYATPEQYLVHVITFVTTLSAEKEAYQTPVAHFTRTIISAMSQSITERYTYTLSITGLLGTLNRSLDRDIRVCAHHNSSIGLLGTQLKPFILTAQAALGIGSTDAGGSVISREDGAEIPAAGSSASRSDTAEATRIDDHIEPPSAQQLPDSAASVNPSETERVVSGLAGEHGPLLPRSPSRTPEEPTNEVCQCKCTIL